MEQDHLPIALPVLEKMRLATTDHVLDVGCGSGWLSQRISKLVPQGRVVGIDISGEMIRVARRTGVDRDNVVFITGEVAEIPWEPNFFTHAISVESAYYWPDAACGAREIHRVLRAEGTALVLINYYRDNPYCHQWGARLAVTTHLRSADEWVKLFHLAGFHQVSHERIIDPSPTPEIYTGRWFRDAAELRAFKKEGALLICARK
jgi:ubiquinone/menaquinone biosynthesis C-methylase UbiE